MQRDSVAAEQLPKSEQCKHPFSSRQRQLTPFSWTLRSRLDILKVPNRAALGPADEERPLQNSRCSTRRDV